MQQEMYQSRRTPPSGNVDIVRTKLMAPPLAPLLVLRPALIARLDAGLAGKATLITAPAGFGKTTLAAAWLSNLERRTQNAEQAHNDSADAVLRSTLYGLRFGWLSLDAGDNDPLRFWRYLLAACRPFAPAISAAALAKLQSPQPSLDAILTAFINALAGLSGRYLLVLEDYHLITSSLIHQSVARLLDQLPPPLHLVLISRSEPPLPLARLRARGELSEIDAVDLRFSADEIQAFLEQALPTPPTPETVARIGARTEGWAAGLRLAALALRLYPDSQAAAAFLDTFSGSHRPIAAYLIAEVLAAQPEPLQTFLLQSALLPRICGPLADAISGRSDGAAMLEQIERSNLFLSPIDAEHQWYRYHALFAEALQHEARRRYGLEKVRHWYARASAWYASHDMLDEAVEAALVARAWPEAADLIERSLTPQITQNEYHTLRRWLDQLPAEVLGDHPALSMTQAIAILFTSDRRAPATLAAVEPPLTRAEQGWQDAGRLDKLGEARAFRAIVAWWQGDLPQSFAAAHQALELLPPQETQWRSTSLIFVALDEHQAGRLQRARQLIVEGRAAAAAADNRYGLLASTHTLGHICIAQGELRQAAALYRQILTSIESGTYDARQARYDQGQALRGLAALAYEWNDFAAAERDALQLSAIGAELGDAYLRVQGQLILAKIASARGDSEQARQLLQTLAAETQPPLLLREVQTAQARLALTSGDQATLQRWLAVVAQADATIPVLDQEQEALLGARVLLAQGNITAAQEILEGWRSAAEAEGRGHSTLEIKALTALVYAASRLLPQARQALAEALTLSQPEGYQRLFLDEGEPMRQLLLDALRHMSVAPTQPALHSYVERLLAAFPANAGPSDLLADNRSNAHQNRSNAQPLERSTALAEPLSPQEQRVLRLIATGMTNPEIAQELVVSVNTVKTQLKSIFRKLDISSRAEARARARSLKLS